MIFWRCEPKLEDMLSDPIVQAVMAADGVEQRQLDDLLTQVARARRAAGRSAEPPSGMSAA
jgi:hypothetical protein